MQTGAQLVPHVVLSMLSVSYVSSREETAVDVVVWLLC